MSAEKADTATVSNNKKKPIPQWSVDSQLLYERLKQMQQGETIDYDTLNAIISGNVQERSRAPLTTARRRALTYDGLVFEAIHNTGLKCLTDEEIARTGTSQARRIRKAAYRASKKLAAVREFDKLSSDAQLQHNLHVSLFGAIRSALGKKSVEVLTAKIEEKQAKLSYREMIAGLLNK